MSPASYRTAPVQRTLYPAQGNQRSVAARNRGPMRWAAVASVLLLVTRVHEIFGGFAAIFRPTLVVPLLLALFSIAKVGFPRRRDFSEFPPLGVYFALGCLTIIGIPFALWPGGAFEFAKGNFLIVIVTAFTLSTFGKAPGDYRSLIRYYCVGFSTVALVNVLRSGGLRNPEGRLGGLGVYDPNDLAALAALSVPFGLSLLFSRGWSWRTLGLLTCALGTVLVLESGSRGGLIALVVGIIVTISGFRLRRGIFISTAATAMMFIAAATVDNSIIARFSTIAAVQDDYNIQSRTGRLEIWKRGLTYMVERPLTGVGIVNFSVAEGQRNQADGVVSAWLNAHNLLVQIGAELGVPGLLLLLFLLIKSFSSASSAWSLWGARASNPEALGALCAFVTAGMFLSLAYSPMLLFCSSVAFWARRSVALEMRGTRPPY